MTWVFKANILYENNIILAFYLYTPYLRKYYMPKPLNGQF